MEFWAVEEHLPLNPTPPPLPIEWLFIISISSNRCASRETRFRAEYPFPVPFPVAPPGSPHLPSITLLRWVTPKEADTSDLKIQTRNLQGTILQSMVNVKPCSKEELKSYLLFWVDNLTRQLFLRVSVATYFSKKGHTPCRCVNPGLFHLKHDMTHLMYLSLRSSLNWSVFSAVPIILRPPLIQARQKQQRKQRRARHSLPLNSLPSMVIVTVAIPCIFDSFFTSYTIGCQPISITTLTKLYEIMASIQKL